MKLSDRILRQQEHMDRVRAVQRRSAYERVLNKIAIAQGLRCPASPRHALLAKNLGKPSLWVNIRDLWYKWRWSADPNLHDSAVRCRRLRGLRS